MQRRGFLLTGAALTTGLAACSSSDESASDGAQPQLMVADAWVRTTEGAKDTTMSAAFMDITNPTAQDRRLVTASTDVSGVTELHEMVMSDGKKLMRKTDAIPVPREGHRHLVSGGYHLMLMNLKRPLAIGDDVTITLEFDQGTTVSVTAMVKEFVEEEDHYHTTPAATPTR